MNAKIQSIEDSCVYGHKMFCSSADFLVKRLKSLSASDMLEIYCTVECVGLLNDGYQTSVFR